MCGRYKLSAKSQALYQRYIAQPSANQVHVPRYNIAPSQQAPVIRTAGTIEMMRWGIIHTSPTDQRGGPNGINVRGETLVKPHYRKLRQQRCLILTDGFYEWDQHTDPKTPYLLTLPDDEFLTMGGVYDETIDPDGVVHASFATVTLPPRGIIASMHHRMPFIVPRENFARWLDPNEAIEPLLQANVYELRKQPVSRLLNSTANENASVLDPTLEPEPKAPKAKPAKPEGPQLKLF